MAEIEEKEHEHKSSGIAKAGLVTGIIGTSLGALNTGVGGGLLSGLTGNNKQAEQIAALRDENIMLKSAALTNEKTNDLNVRLVRQEEQIKSMRMPKEALNTQSIGDEQSRSPWRRRYMAHAQSSPMLATKSNVLPNSRFTAVPLLP